MTDGAPIPRPMDPPVVTADAEQTVFEFDDAWLPLGDAPVMSTTIDRDPVTAAAVAPFDLEWDGTTSFMPVRLPSQLPTDFGIGVIVGASGSGKTTLLREFGVPAAPTWTDAAIAAHFDSATDAADRFYAVGLNAVPTWTKPYRVLSNGERFRADLARVLDAGAAIDEFTSVVDRHVAMSTSNAIRRHVETHRLRRIVIATCHRDVLPWLQPDWVIDTDIRCWALHPRGCLQRPNIVVTIYAGTTDGWQLFRRHHYLSDALNPAAVCMVAVWDDTVIGFAAALPFPNGNLRNAWRGHRTVVLPDFQGLGIGMRLSDWVGEWMIARGRRYFSRTAHPRMGAYRDASPLWRATTASQKPQRVLTSYMSDEYIARRERTGWSAWDFDDKRVAWSHEYVGADPAAHPVPPIVRAEPLTLGL